MRSRYEFAFHTLKNLDGDPELTLCGSLGWEIRGISEIAGVGHLVALQRPLDEEVPLPRADAIAVALEAPLVVPSGEDEER